LRVKKNYKAWIAEYSIPYFKRTRLKPDD